MSLWGNEAVYGNLTVAEAPAAERVAFMRRTYLHLFGAILAFVGLETALFQTGFAYTIYGWVASHRWGGFVAMGLFMLAGYLAERWATSYKQSAGIQYAGLGLYVVAQAIFIAPLLVWSAALDASIIPAAAVTTLTAFTGLTGVVLLTKKDFSFIGPALGMAGLLLFGTLLCSIFFGWGGIYPWCCAGIVAVMCGYVLYYTSRIQHHYLSHQHVAASLALFATLGTMFWYILQLFAFSRD